VRELTRAYVDAWDAVVPQLTDALTRAGRRPGHHQDPGATLEPGSPPRCRPSPTSSTTWPRTPSVVISDGAGQVTSIAVTAQAAIAGTQLPAAGYPLVDVNPT
jgi:hypothetical protein